MKLSSLIYNVLRFKKEIIFYYCCFSFIQYMSIFLKFLEIITPFPDIISCMFILKNNRSYSGSSLRFFQYA